MVYSCHVERKDRDRRKGPLDINAVFKIDEGERAAVWSGIAIRREHVIDCPGLMIRCSYEANIAFIKGDIDLKAPEIKGDIKGNTGINAQINSPNIDIPSGNLEIKGPKLDKPNLPKKLPQ